MDTSCKMKYFSQVDASAIGAVLQSWKARHPGVGVLALLPESEKDKVSVLQQSGKECGVPLVGAIFPALVWETQFMTSGVLLLCLPEMPYYALYDHLPVDTQAAEKKLEEIAHDLRGQIDHQPDLTLFMLFDAMVPNIGTLLDGLYLHLANRVHYAGANAGSETFQPMPCLFDNQRLVQNGVLLLLLKQHKGAILEHGYHTRSRNSYATSTKGNCISQIDWQSAFKIYQELIREHYGGEVTRENFYQYGVHFPFGIVRANHHVLVRIPVALSDDGSLFCVGEVPANSVLALLKAPTVHMAETLHALSNGLKGLNGPVDAAELLLFYCAGRRMHLGLEMATAELEGFKEETAAKHVAGALSLGEIGGSNVNGYPLFHNATLVASCW